MNDKERCVICGNEISNTMIICPRCGSVINRYKYHISSNNCSQNSKDKNLEYLDKMDVVLCHLEEELDAFLCKKR